MCIAMTHTVENHTLIVFINMFCYKLQEIYGIIGYRLLSEPGNIMTGRNMHHIHNAQLIPVLTERVDSSGWLIVLVLVNMWLWMLSEPNQKL